MSVDVTGIAASSVTGAIRQAAQRTGTSFDYLIATAKVKSNLNPNAKATSSTAGGLFQFIEQTWLGTLKHAGSALGYGRYAEAISVNSSGQYEVRDARLKQQILGLRTDPGANALMAGVLTKSNGELLAARLGRNATEGELYLAHFLGAAGASKLITLAGSSPRVSAAEVFPRAADANRSIFYNKQGEARSVAQVYDMMVGRHNIARARTIGPATATNVAAAPIRAFPPVAPGASPNAGFQPLPPLALSALQGPSAYSGPVFHGLFRTGERQEAVAPVVTALWATQTPVQADQGIKPAAPAAKGFGGMLDLFRDNG